MRAFPFTWLLFVLVSACVERSNRGAVYCDKQADCTDPLQPLCDTEFHTCYAADAGLPLLPCTPDTKCPARAPICSNGFCSGCVSNDQCKPNVCQSSGTCAPIGDTIYVDNKNGTCTGVHGGTQADPYCQLGPAIAAALAASKPIIRIAGSSASYDAVEFNPTVIFNLTILGPDSPTPQSKVVIYRKDATALSIRTEATGTLTVQKVEFQGSNGATSKEQTSGVYCFGSGVKTVLTLRDSAVYGAGSNSVQVGRCTVNFERVNVHDNRGGGVAVVDAWFNATDSQFHHNQSSGIAVLGYGVTVVRRAAIYANVSDGLFMIGDVQLTATFDQVAIYDNSGSPILIYGDPRYFITNNVIWANKYGVSLAGGNGVFMFNSVTDNGVGGVMDIRGGGIDCRDPATVQHSIVLGNGRSTEGSQLSATCLLTNVVTGAGDPRGIAKNVDFDGSAIPYHLRVNSPANRDCCVNKVPKGPSFPAYDYLGTARPIGSAFDIGAYEIE